MPRPTREEVVDLYTTRRMTTRAIGALYGVSKTEVRRWMILYHITARAGSCGLANRGVQGPSKDELQRMVHAERLTYATIAARYGVDPSAVPHWLRAQGLTLPRASATWRSHVRTNHVAVGDELAALYERHSADDIARTFGVSAQAIYDRLKQAGILRHASGWVGRRKLSCADGHVVRSPYEQRVDDWLSAHDIAHEYEPHVPWHHQSRADFKVGAVFVEIWGVTHNVKYKAQVEHKRAKYAAMGLALVELYPADFSASRDGRYAEKLAAAFL